VHGTRRRLVLSALAAFLVVAGCGGRTASPPPVLARPPSTYRPAILPPTLETLAPSSTLPLPVNIPDDPYAPEPVTRIGTIEIPKIGLSHPLFEGVTLHNIDLGPSHWTGSALPGQPGNAVFAGHRVTNDHPFRRIDELVPGDLVRFTVHGATSTYRVSESMVVGPDDTWIATQTPAATATIYACHPPGSAAYRYVVRLELASA
jgi:sortase A